MRVMVDTTSLLVLGGATLVDTRYGSSTPGVQCIFYGDFELCYTREVQAPTTQTFGGRFVY